MSERKEDNIRYHLLKVRGDTFARKHIACSEGPERLVCHSQRASGTPCHE